MLKEFEAQVLNGQLVPAEPLRIFEGQRVHVTVTASDQGAPSPDDPTPEIAEQVMLQPWVDFPFTPILTIRAQPGVLPLPDPPEIPNDTVSGSIGLSQSAPRTRTTMIV